jgi:hypothetical protein
MKCEMPAWAAVSRRDPAPIQTPSAIERTPGSRWLTTRSPPSSVESSKPSIAEASALSP